MPKTTIGMPGAVLLPLKAKHYELVGSIKNITLPIEGEFPNGDSFTLYDENNCIHFGEIIRVLHYLDQYPRLEEDEVFSIPGLVVKDDKIIIVGQKLRNREFYDRDERDV